MVLADGRTVGDHILPQITEAYEQQGGPPSMLALERPRR